MARSRDLGGGGDVWAAGRPRTAAGNAVVSGNAHAWQHQRRPAQGNWRDSHPPPQLPKAIHGRVQPALSAVEAIFRAQYYAAAEPEPIDVQGIYRSLAGEPETWAGPAGPERVRLPQVKSLVSAPATAPAPAATAPAAASASAAGTPGSYMMSQGVQTVARAATPREMPRNTAMRTPRPRSALGLLSRHPAAGGRSSPIGASGAPSATAERASSRGRGVGSPKEVCSHEAAGVDREMSPYLLERVRQLSASSTALPSSPTSGHSLMSDFSTAFSRGCQLPSAQGPVAWVIVEICRDCARHDASLRHDERAYLARYLQLKDAILRSFPVGIAVDLLVPLDISGTSPPGASHATARSPTPQGVSSASPGCRGGGCCAGCNSLSVNLGGSPQPLPTNLCGGYSAGFAAGYAAAAQPSSARRESPGRDWRDGPGRAIYDASSHERSSSRASPVPASGEASANSASVPRVRIGAFEVYLCCTEPLRLDGGCALVPRSRRESSQGGTTARRQLFLALCLASKLRTRAWPAADAVVARLAASMPRIPLRARILTELELPITGAQLAVVPGKATGSRYVGSGVPLLDGAGAGRVSPAFGGRGPSYEGADGDASQDVSASSGSRLDSSSVLAAGETDSDGCCEFAVPACTNLNLHAWHEHLMEPQVREIRITQIMPPEIFLAETVVQLWQAESAKELIIYCSSPRSAGSLNTRATAELKPFQGTIDSSRNDQQLVQDSRGTLWRGMHDPLDDKALLMCDGWRSATISQTAKDMHGTGRVVEVARLGVPIVQASLIAPCCKASVPDAQVSIDGEVFGTTSSDGAPVNCGVRCGDHTLRVEHALTYNGVKMALTVSGSTTFGVEVKLPLERLRFVCVGDHGRRAAGSCADLWLVAGDLSEWRASGFGPANDAEVWLWDGELCGAEGHVGAGGSDGPLLVQAGVLAAGSFAEMEPETQSYSDSDAGQCVLSQALTLPCCTHGPWRTALRPAEAQRGCLLCHLAKMPAAGVPAYWVARLASRGTGSPQSPGTRGSTVQMAMRSGCCSAGFPGAEVLVGGMSCGKTNDLGQVTLSLGGGLSQASSPSGSSPSRKSPSPQRRGKDQAVELRIQGVPACLLPGCSTEYVLQWQAQELGEVSLDMACLLWVYWMPPEEPFEPDSEAESVDEVVEEEPPQGTVWISADSELVPEEAQPLTGVLECLGAKVPEIQLDGRSMGPFILAPSETAAAREAAGAPCLLSGLVIHPRAPQGFTYRAREPSPLAERCMELGGCEHQRLVCCPVVMGYLSQIQEPTSAAGGARASAPSEKGSTNSRWADPFAREG